MPHPSEVPIEQWSPGWLVFECAMLLKEPGYLVMHHDERKAKGWPATADEMRAFITKHRNRQ